MPNHPTRCITASTPAVVKLTESLNSLSPCILHQWHCFYYDCQVNHIPQAPLHANALATEKYEWHHEGNRHARRRAAMIRNFESGPNACWTCPLCIRIWNHIVNFNGSPVFLVARRRCHACMTFRRMWLSDSLCPNMYTNRAPSDWWTAAPFVFDFNPACHGSFLFLVSVSPDLQIGAKIYVFPAL